MNHNESYEAELNWLESLHYSISPLSRDVYVHAGHCLLFGFLT